MVPARINRQQGGMLLVVTALVSIIVLAYFAKQALKVMETRLLNNSSISNTLTKLDTAFINYVAQHKRLPCPADGRIASDQVNAGVAMSFPACTAQRYGVVPWVTLGISENDARDPWNGRISYRVDPALAGNVTLLMDMSLCDVSGTGTVTAGGACRTPTPPCASNSATCTSPSTFLVNKGLDVWDGVGGAVGWGNRAYNRTLGTGAAYVIISHGPTGAGAYNSNGIYQPGTQAAGNDELANLNNQNIALPATQTNTYRNAVLDTSSGLSSFDDYVSNPLISTVLKKAQLQERVH